MEPESAEVTSYFHLPLWRASLAKKQRRSSIYLGLPCVKEADGGIAFKADFGTAQNHGATARIERQTALQGRITRAVLQAEPETAEAVGCRPLWGIPRKVHKRWKNVGLSGRGYF